MSILRFGEFERVLFFMTRVGLEQPHEFGFPCKYDAERIALAIPLLHQIMDNVQAGFRVEGVQISTVAVDNNYKPLLGRLGGRAKGIKPYNPLTTLLGCPPV